MSESHLQHVLADSHASTSSRLDTLVASKLYSCHPIWDSENATFSECALPYFSAIPVSIAALLGLGYILAPLLAPWRPEWTKSFVVEFPSELPELPKPKRNGFSEWTLTLVTLSIAASAALMVELIPNPSNLSVMLLLAGWILVSAVNVSRRSRSSPASLLLFYISTLVVHLLLVVDAQNPSEWVAMSAAIGSILVILMMPLRDSSLPSSGISKVGEIPTCQQRSPEDSLRLWEFLSVSWMGPMISIGKSRQLNEEDVWALGFEFQHKRLHESFRQLKGSVIQRLLRANGIDVAIIICTASVETICEFAMPVLLQQLLKAMENPFSPKRIALTYSLLGLMVQGIEAQSEVLTLWYGRRCYERSRGEMTMMVYEKALSRKNVVGQEETEKANDKANEAKDANGTALNGAPMSKTKYHRYCGFFQRFWSKSEKSKVDTKQPASMGKILNLIRGDVYEIAQRFWDIESLVEKPLGLVFGVVLVWILLGPSCFVGIITIVIAQAVNVLITKVLLQWERKRRTASDKRLNVTSTFVEAIRHLRYYSWENHWLKQIMEARQHELYMRVVTTLFRTVITLVNSLASGLFPVAALYAYTFLYGHRLSIDVIFPALQLFGKLESSLREIPGLITTLLNAYISVGRIEDFMNEDNKESKAADPSVDPSSLELIDCTFAWPGAIGTIPPVLHNINLSFRPGFNVICGKVGAGKSALLQALLGELDTIQGEVKMPDEMIGYCAQSPWLQSMSIRDNILFSSPFNEDRYSQVLECCELLPDLAEFKHGDLSFIGENGIGLSGGQKARVALARAVYSRSNILILDDPLSALDFQTGETIVRKCFKGPLMEKKTIILVTHRTDLVSHLANQVIAITDGSATVLNSDVLSENGFANGIDTKVPNSTEEEINANGNSGISTPDKFMDEEHRAEWGVQARVYWKYIKSGGLNWWALLIVALACHRSLSIAQSWFLKSWGEGYNEESQSFILIDRAGDMFSSKSFSSTQNFSVSKLSWHNPITDFPSPADDVRPWLVAFLVIAILQSVMLLTVSLVQLAIMYCAGKTLFAEAMLAVSRATFRFYDVTPVGRLMNRLTSDIGTIDGNIANSFMGIANNSITWCASVFIIATVTPAFLVFAFLISGIFVWIFFQFLPTSQSLRRLEMVSLSPLMSNFGELLHGLTTVRAFQAEHNFQDRVIATVDKFQGMDHFYWSTQNWLMFRYDFLAASSSFALKVLALYTNVSPGLTAFVLIAAGNYVSATRFLCRRYGQLQMDFVSVERVDELLHVDQEETGSVDPPASWPIFGSEIIFEDVTIRYAPTLDPSLTNISLHIPGGSTTAIVGRTGSGKSTLAISLLAVVRPESGRILIDNIDLATVSTKALRERITFVAQDPVLFSGTIRLNLDPTSSYTDAECTTALERICHRYAWTLETPIEAGGRNLSQGQRQLIGLTRAVLRRSPVVILDEATASIDSESSMEIQQVLREEMGAATVLMIAHRVEAVNGANFAVVLDKGRVVRAGPAGEVGEGIVREALGRV